MRALFFKGFFSELLFPLLKNNLQSNKLLLWHINKGLSTSTWSTTTIPTSKLPMFTHRFLVCKCLGFLLGFYLWLAPSPSRTRPIVSLRSSGPCYRCYSHLHPCFLTADFGWLFCLLLARWPCGNLVYSIIIQLAKFSRALQLLAIVSAI